MGEAVTSVRGVCLAYCFAISVTPVFAADPTPVTMDLVQCPLGLKTAFDVAENGSRIIIDKQQPLYFYVGKLSPDGKVHEREALNDGQATETERKTQIVQDLEAVLQAIDSKKGADQGGPDCARYTPKNLRAKVDISLKYDPSPTKKNVEGNRTYTVGPEEHFYLSADVPVSSIKQLKLDTSSNKLVESKTPASFYIDLSYKIGDIYTNYPSIDIHNLVLKLFAKASNKPSESAGFGIGYATKYADFFVARLLTQSDSSVPAGSASGTWSTAIGVSFDIAKGIGWFTGK